MHRVIFCLALGLGLCLALLSGMQPACAQNPQPPTADELIAAIRSEDTARVAALLRQGANPDAIDTDEGLSALQLAAFLCEADITQLLLNAGANPNFTDQTRANALHWALECMDFVRRDRIVRQLVEAGANPSQPDDQGHTPLFLAVLDVDTTAIKHLLLVSANPNEPDNTGLYPLSVLLNSTSLGPVHLRCAQLLLDAHASPDATLPDTGDALLHQAVRAQHTALVHLLLDHQAATDQRNNKGQTPLDIAQQLGNADIINILAARSLQPQKP